MMSMSTYPYTAKCCSCCCTSSKIPPRAAMLSAPATLTKMRGTCHSMHSMLNPLPTRPASALHQRFWEHVYSCVYWLSCGACRYVCNVLCTCVVACDHVYCHARIPPYTHHTQTCTIPYLAPPTPSPTHVAPGAAAAAPTTHHHQHLLDQLETTTLRHRHVHPSTPPTHPRTPTPTHPHTHPHTHPRVVSSVWQWLWETGPATHTQQGPLHVHETHRGSQGHPMPPRSTHTHDDMHTSPRGVAGEGGGGERGAIGGGGGAAGGDSTQPTRETGRTGRRLRYAPRNPQYITWPPCIDVPPSMLDMVCVMDSNSADWNDTREVHTSCHTNPCIRAIVMTTNYILQYPMQYSTQHMFPTLHTLHRTPLVV